MSQISLTGYKILMVEISAGMRDEVIIMMSLLTGIH